MIILVSTNIWVREILIENLCSWLLATIKLFITVNLTYINLFMVLFFSHFSGATDRDLENSQGGLLLQESGSSLIDTSPGYPSTAPWVETTLGVDGSLGLTVPKGAAVSQTNGPMTWTLTLDATNQILVSDVDAGNSVSQASNSGAGTIISLAKDASDVWTLTIEAAIGQIFDKDADVVVDRTDSRGSNALSVSFLQASMLTSTSTTAKAQGELMTVRKHIFIFF